MIDRFVDRATELELLNGTWQQASAQLVVVLGRRRIGKTALLRHFGAGRRIVHHVATRLPEAQQLAELGELVGQALGDPILAENGFRDWRQVLALLSGAKERLGLVLDEFPYLVESSPTLPSMLQRA